jgi:hypothetical protein
MRGGNPIRNSLFATPSRHRAYGMYFLTILASDSFKIPMPRAFWTNFAVRLIMPWRLPAWPALTLPEAVILKRFFAPDLVFIFGILVSSFVVFQVDLSQPRLASDVRSEAKRSAVRPALPAGSRNESRKRQRKERIEDASQPQALGNARGEVTLASFKALACPGISFVACGRLPERESHATMKDSPKCGFERPTSLDTPPTLSALQHARPVLRRDAFCGFRLISQISQRVKGGSSKAYPPPRHAYAGRGLGEV